MQSRFYLMSVGLVLSLALSATSTTFAQPAKKKEAVQDAIKKGTQYLLDAHKPDPQYDGGSNQIGTACLAGMALLECGVDEKNPSLHNIVKFVRAGCLQETSTYHVSLCIMFLDRLGHPQDEGLIQFLGVRLMGGQLDDGGWSYQCGGYPLTAQQEARLRSASAKDAKLVNTTPRVGSKEDPAPKDKPKKEESAKKSDYPSLHPEVGKILNEMQGQNPRRKGELAPKFPGFKNGGGFGFGVGDNSNTQFATLGLWCARRHGLSIEKSMLALEERFRTTQMEDGGWSYMGGIYTSPAMTCAGLIGLAVSFGTHQAVLKNKRDANAAEPAPRKGGKVDLGEDEMVKRGLKKLGQYITDAKNGGVEEGFPRGRKGGGEEGFPRGKKGGGMFGGGSLSGNLYFLWSLERVAVIFGLETIGKNDWYAWASKAIVDSQFEDGSWSSAFPGGAPGDVSTPLALLILNRANVAKDLTATITGRVKDPGISFLKSGGDLSKVAPGVKKDPPKDAVATQPKEPAQPDAKQADPAADYEKQVNRLVESVVQAKGEQQVEILKTLRDSKGALYTEALTRAVLKLTGDSQALAREALARRLTRMSANTLREMLRDDQREIRRAAAAACGFKADKQYVPDLIDLLADKDVLVVHSAHESLKTLTSTDFGPAPDAADSDKTKAILAWRNWLKSQKN